MGSEQLFQAIVRMPVMHVGVRTEADKIVEIRYLDTSTEIIRPKNSLAERAARQLERYAADPDFAFDLPLAEAGSAFQRRVWQGGCRVPRGRPRTSGPLPQA